MWSAVRCKAHRLQSSHAFHAGHGVAHIAYFVAVMVEGHGIYAAIGGIMVIFSLVTVITDDLK